MLVAGLPAESGNTFDEAKAAGSPSVADTVIRSVAILVAVRSDRYSPSLASHRSF